MAKKLASIVSAAVLLSCNAEVQLEEFNPDEARAEINRFLDEWHDDAAQARPAYFDKIADAGVYIGTDKTELWEKEEFREWAGKYFDEGQAWDFDARDRNIYLSEKGEYAWFDELLDTWMGPSRGSGVLHRTDEGWKIKHYHLGLTVPNDTLDGFIEMVKAYEQKNKAQL